MWEGEATSLQTDTRNLLLPQVPLARRTHKPWGWPQAKWQVLGGPSGNMEHQSINERGKGAWGGQRSGTQLDMLSSPSSCPRDKWPFLQPVGVATHSSFVPVVQGCGAC